MNREILIWYKYIKYKPSSKVYRLLCSALFLILWMKTFSSSVVAQVNSSSTNNRVVPKPLTNQLEDEIQLSNQNNSQNLENNSIVQIATCGVTPKKQSPSVVQELKNQSHNCWSGNDNLSSDLPSLVVRETSEEELELPEQLRKVEVFQSCNDVSDCNHRRLISQVPIQTFNQLLDLEKLPQQERADTETVEENPESLIPLSVERSLNQPVEQEQQETNARKGKPLREPSLKFQGVYINQEVDSSARARLTGIYPLSPQSLIGGTVDLISENNSFDDSDGEGLDINELYYATSLKNLPNLRFVIGQMDLTSYFDRNSFAKDGATHFFNSVFQTNPALSSTGIGSRPGLLVNWNANDNLITKAAVFSSSRNLSDFSLDAFAGEVGVRFGNAIIRGTYSTDRDAGNRDSFLESFGIARGNNQFGPLEDDRESAYGLNAEIFIPEYKLGLFGRYGRYENQDLDKGADTYSFGLSFLDLFTPDDRLGLAYGRALSNDGLRQGKQPDVVELFYDLKLHPNLRLGLTFQGRDSFNESILGIRVKTEFDITPRRRSNQ